MKHKAKMLAKNADIHSKSASKINKTKHRRSNTKAQDVKFGQEKVNMHMFGMGSSEFDVDMIFGSPVKEESKHEDNFRPSGLFSSAGKPANINTSSRISERMQRLITPSVNSESQTEIMR